jgi:hypothetical protein
MAAAVGAFARAAAPGDGVPRPLDFPPALADNRFTPPTERTPECGESRDRAQRDRRWIPVPVSPSPVRIPASASGSGNAPGGP